MTRVNPASKEQSDERAQSLDYYYLNGTREVEKFHLRSADVIEGSWMVPGSNIAENTVTSSNGIASMMRETSGT